MGCGCKGKPQATPEPIKTPATVKLTEGQGVPVVTPEDADLIRKISEKLKELNQN